MSKLRMLWLAFTVVAAFGTVATASASAFEWLVAGAAIAVGERWNTDETFTSRLFTDIREGIDILCLNATGLRWLERAGLGVVVEWHCGSIQVDEGACENGKLEAVDLPWSTKLNAEKLDEVTADGKGNPGWLLECTVLGVKVDDTCTIEKEKNKVENAVEGIAIEDYEEPPEAERDNCTLGGEKTGEQVGGNVNLEALTANGLETRTLSIS